MPRPNAPAPPVGAGLCADCAHAREQRSARGGSFLRCALAERRPGWRRYPQLPVRVCEGYERKPAGVGDTGRPPRC